VVTSRSDLRDQGFFRPRGYTGKMTKPSKVDLVGVGLNATDTLIALPDYPERGSKVEYSGATVLPGGQVATTVVACQLWGMSTRYVGILGDDSAADLHREAFTRAGVQTELVTVPGGTSPQSLILVDGGGERTVLCRRDPRVALKPDDLDRQWIVNARALHVDGYDTAAATVAAGWARAAGIPVIADLDELYPGVEQLLQNVDYLIVSRDIPCRLMGESDLEMALRQMQRCYGCRLTAATLGENGVLAWNGKQIHHVSAYSVPVVDTTGAGDIFHAGFIYGLVQNWPLERQLDFACAAAALNCTSVGARGGIHAVEAIEGLMTTGVRHLPAQCAAG
jgi:sulfofructose kinase